MIFWRDQVIQLLWLIHLSCVLAMLVGQAVAHGRKRQKTMQGQMLLPQMMPGLIFKAIEPHHHFRFSVNYGHWQFRIECGMKSKKLKYPYHQGSYSKSFAKSKDMWKDC